MKVIVSNIQRFCLHDGPGIRTTVFFKGCSLNCPWCANPENIDFNIQEYIEDGEKKSFGYEITLEDLKKEILKDEDYYSSGGGVTFSGGECLLQFKKIEPLLKELKNRGINICVETSLNAPSEYVDIAIKYVDEFYIDIKILDSATEKLIGSNSKLYYKNIEKIINNNANVIYRMPLVYDYTYTDENNKKLIDFVKKYKVNKIELFRLHNLGDYKYKLLNKEIKQFEKVSDSDINKLKTDLESLNVEVSIISI